MADFSVGKIFVELDLDPSRYTKGQQALLKSATQTTLNIEQNFKNLGIKSSAEMDLMRQKIMNSYNMITNNAKSSANDILRAEKAKNEQLARLNEMQFGAQTSMISKLKSHWLAASAVIASAGIVAAKGWDMAKAGADFKEQQGILDNLSRKYETTADSIVKDMRRASENLIADADLMQIALGGIAKGLNPEQLTNLADAARILGDAVGKDATTALKDLTEALETGRTKGLKNYLGTAIDLRTEFGELESKLTEAEKSQALYNIAMIEATKLQGEQTNKVDGTGDAIERLEAKWKNLRSTVEQSLAGLVGLFLGTSEGEEQARLARARLAYMKSSNIDYASLSKMTSQDQNKYIDSLIAAENSMSEGARFAGKSVNSYRAALSKIKSNAQNRVDSTDAAKSKREREEDARIKKALDDIKKWEEVEQKKAELIGEVALLNNQDYISKFAPAVPQTGDVWLKKYLEDVEKAEKAEQAKSELIWELTKTDYEMEEKYADKKMLLSDDFFGGVKIGYKQLLKDQETWANSGLKIFKSFARNGQNTISDVLFDGIKGDLKDFEDYWDSFFDSLLRTFTDAVAEMATQKLAEAAVSGLATVGGYVGGMALDWLGDSLISSDLFLHSGAYYVGQDQTKDDRLKQDEFLKILQRGEMVVPKNIADQMRSGDYSGLAGFMNGSAAGASLSGYSGTSSINSAIGASFNSSLANIGKTQGMKGLAGLGLGMTTSQALDMAIQGGLIGVIGAGWNAVLDSLMDEMGITTGSKGAKFGSTVGSLYGGGTFGVMGALGLGMLGRALGSLFDTMNESFGFIGGGYGAGGYGIGSGFSIANDRGWGGGDGGFGGGGPADGPGTGGPGDSTPGFRYGGLSRGPDSGYTARLHGTEMVVSQKKDVPVKIAGGGDLPPVQVNLVVDGKTLAKVLYKQSRAGVKAVHDRGITNV